MKDRNLIPFSKDEKGNIIVSGRDLHDFLEIETPFRKWIPRMIKYGFEENVDYTRTDKKVRANRYGATTDVEDIAMTLDMAKEISMIQRNEKGKQARQYFVQVEKNYKRQQEELPASNLNKLVQISTNLVQSQQETKEQLNDNTSRITKLENDMTMNRREAGMVHDLGKKVATRAMGGYGSNAYKKIGRKVYSRLWINFNHHFGNLASYLDLEHVNVPAAMDYLSKEWHPDNDIKDEIAALNNQTDLDI